MTAQLIYFKYYYRIRDKETGQYYSGSKYGKDADPSTFWTKGGYFTSSNTILSLIEEFGPERFEVVKIIPMNDPYSFETRFLQRIDAENHSMFYNRHNNTFGSESDVNSNTTWINNGKIEKKIHENEQVPNGFKPGRLEMSGLWKKNLSEAAKNRKDPILSEEAKKMLSISKDSKWCNNGKTNKRIKKEEMIPEGYSLGRISWGSNKTSKKWSNKDKEKHSLRMKGNNGIETRTPLGLFPSMKEAANAHKISYKKLKRLLENEWKEI